MKTDKPETAAQKALAEIAPKLAELTDQVLFGDVWERPQLSKRDRSLITCAALVATGSTCADDSNLTVCWRSFRALTVRMIESSFRDPVSSKPSPSLARMECWE